MRPLIPLIAILALTTAAWQHPAPARSQDAPADRPRPRADDRPFNPRHHDTPLTDEQRAEVLLVIKDISPRWHQRITTHQDTHPQRTRQFLARLHGPMTELIEARRHDPELYQQLIADRRLKIENAALAMKIRKAKRDNNAPLANQITAELRNNIERQLDLRHQLRHHRLARMEEKLNALRAELDGHALTKGEVIDRQIDRLLSGKQPDGFRRGAHPRGSHTPNDDRPRPPFHRPPQPNEDAQPQRDSSATPRRN